MFLIVLGVAMVAVVFGLLVGLAGGLLGLGTGLTFGVLGLFFHGWPVVLIAVVIVLLLRDSQRRSEQARYAQWLAWQEEQKRRADEAARTAPGRA